MIIKPQRLLGEGLLASADRYQDKVAIISEGREYTFGQLKEDSMALASALLKIGLARGDRVAIYMDNSWTEAVAIYATTLAGGVFIAINPQTKGDKLQYILNDSGARILFAESRLEHELNIACNNTEQIEYIILHGRDVDLKVRDGINVENIENVSSAGNVKPLALNIIPNDLASLIYTSGSTGFPKGVMMTHQSMVFATWSLIEYLRLSQEERIMLVLPLSFDYGLYQLLMSVTIGATLIIEKSFIFLGSIYKQIEKTKPTVFPGVPTVFAMMISSYKRKPFSFDSVTKITNTAAALSTEYIPWLKKIFPNALIFKMYGLTECKRVSYLEPELIDKKTASVGKAIPGTEVFILRDDGKIAAPNEPGILYVRGPHVMAGYWNQEELSQEVLKPGKLPGERILCTNDLFKMDKEGFLYFVGRNDDIIKTRGEKVSPVEVENVINKLPGVNESAVIGVPDDIMGQVLVAYITCEKGKPITEKEVQQFCAGHLESFMIPQKVFILESLPKNANGKIDKLALLKQSL